jgi:polygalacturonase
VNDVAPWFRWLVVTPRGPGHYIQGLSVSHNVFRTVNCTIERIEQVDDTQAGLDLGRLRNVVFEGNTFNGVGQFTMSPVVIRHDQATAAETWTVDGAAYLPFAGRARTVTAVVAEGALVTGAGQTASGQPFALTEQGPGGALAALRWPVPVRGRVQVTLRCDNPI